MRRQMLKTNRHFDSEQFILNTEIHRLKTLLDGNNSFLKNDHGCLKTFDDEVVTYQMHHTAPADNKPGTPDTVDYEHNPEASDI